MLFLQPGQRPVLLHRGDDAVELLLKGGVLPAKPKGDGGGLHVEGEQDLIAGVPVDEEQPHTLRKGNLVELPGAEGHLHGQEGVVEMDKAALRHQGAEEALKLVKFAGLALRKISIRGDKGVQGPAKIVEPPLKLLLCRAQVCQHPDVRHPGPGRCQSAWGKRQDQQKRE